MDCFRIDESGYTGFDLLNAEQRFQGATAIAISDEDAARRVRRPAARAGTSAAGSGRGVQRKRPTLAIVDSLGGSGKSAIHHPEPASGYFPLATLAVIGAKRRGY